MNADIVHAGFDGLRVTVDALIPFSTSEILAAAKGQASQCKSAVPVTIGAREFAVRHTGNGAFSIHTGEYGAEFFLRDPASPPSVGPGITMDFRAFFLATGGLDGARAYFHKCMHALQVRLRPGHIRISRVDFAVDFLAPWFVPDVEAVILPARTSKREFREKDTTGGYSDTSQRFFANTEVTGITCGHVSNRQLVIYDKRAEVLVKHKPAWQTIWNQNRAKAGQPPIDLSDRNLSKVWRVENRVGSKCLRRRWQINGWDDLDAMIGDVFNESIGKMRYAEPQSDMNRSRWPDHELWLALRGIYESKLNGYRSGVIPSEVREVNRAEHMRMTDQNITGNLIARAVASEIKPDEFWEWAKRHMTELEHMSEDHKLTLEQRFAKAEGKYRFR